MVQCGTVHGVGRCPPRNEGHVAWKSCLQVGDGPDSNPTYELEDQEKDIKLGEEKKFRE